MLASLFFIFSWFSSYCGLELKEKSDTFSNGLYLPSNLSLGPFLLSAGGARVRYNFDFLSNVPSLSRAAWRLQQSDSKQRYLEDLYSSLHSHIQYLETADQGAVRRAFKFAFLAHYDQDRCSGEPFIEHPVEVAKILAQDTMDSATLIAGLLHDVVEKTVPSINEIEKEFGKEVRQLVDGVTEVSKVTDIANQEDEQAENLRSFIIAVSSEWRVLIVKLAECLHNMRTLDALPWAKQIDKAKEALEIYAPLAHRFGLWQYKTGLSDLAFKYIHRKEHLRIQEYMRELIRRRARSLRPLKDGIENIKSQDPRLFNAEVQCRTKDKYSIYKKMRKRDCSIDEINDILAVRVIIEERDTSLCYVLLSKLHSLWEPIPGTFKDYIASPKENNYQSLHTTLPIFGQPIEVQIRTRDMHDVAEYGVAAHWQYKLDGQGISLAWLETLEEFAKEMNPQQFLEAIRTKLNSRSIFVFEGSRVHEFPRGTTVEQVLTQYGYDGSHALYVNGEYRGLTERLKSKDRIEVRRIKRRLRGIHKGLGFTSQRVRQDSNDEASDNYAERCQECLPLPDDSLIGRSMLHRDDCCCQTLEKSQDSSSPFLGSLSGRGWGRRLACKFVAFGQDRSGIIADMDAALQRSCGEVKDLRPRVLHPGEDAVIELTVRVNTKQQLLTLMRAAEKVEGVTRVLRGSIEQLSSESPSEFWRNCRQEPSSRKPLAAQFEQISQ